MLSKLISANNSQKKPKRVGRGTGSGLGKTSGRGHKGQKARSGNSHRKRVGFEGGQMPLQRRLPKFGFVSEKNKDMLVVTTERLATSKKIDKSAQINLEVLKKCGFAQKYFKTLKIIGNSSIDVVLDIVADKASAGAVKTVEKAGGKLTLMSVSK